MSPKKLKRIRTLEIDRSTWVHAGNRDSDEHVHDGVGPTALLNEDGFQCCLGFFCEKAGAKRIDLLSTGTPEGLSYHYDIPMLLTEDGSDSKFASAAMRINDDRDCAYQVTRENRLKRLFAKHKIKLTFVGKTVYSSPKEQRE